MNTPVMVFLGAEGLTPIVEPSYPCVDAGNGWYQLITPDAIDLWITVTVPDYQPVGVRVRPTAPTAAGGQSLQAATPIAATSQDSIDVRNFEKTITTDGWYVVHVRQRPEPCTYCHGHEPDTRCRYCLGTGHRINALPLLVRCRTPGASINEESGTPLGPLEQEERVYYCRASELPRRNDLLLEVTWSVPTARVSAEGQIVMVHDIYRVADPDLARGEGGVPAYGRVATSRLAVDTAWVIAQLAPRPSE